MSGWKNLKLATRTHSGAPSGLSRRQALAYGALLCLRAALALLPLSYIHPDEFLQTVEVRALHLAPKSALTAAPAQIAASDMLGTQATRTWEWTTIPVRSIVSLCVVAPPGPVRWWWPHALTRRDGAAHRPCCPWASSRFCAATTAVSQRHSFVQSSLGARTGGVQTQHLRRPSSLPCGWSLSSCRTRAVRRTRAVQQLQRQQPIAAASAVEPDRS